MKLKYISILQLALCLALAGCFHNSNTQRTLPKVETIGPTMVSSEVAAKRSNVGSYGVTSSGAGVVKPYVPTDDGAANTPQRSAAGLTHEIKPYSQVVSEDSNAPAGYYRVQPGDTMYSIAFHYGKDYRVLAKDNGIAAPYSISAGQLIRLDSKAQSSAAASSAQSAAKPSETVKPGSSGSSNNGIYVVKHGDTAVSVAKSHGLKLSDLVAYNNLKKPYALYSGQKLYLYNNSKNNTVPTSQPKDVPVAGNNSSVTISQSPSAGAAAAVDTAAPVKVVQGKSATVAGISWMWPVKGTVIKGFSSANKGIDIAGKLGQDISAAAAGQVVYSGNALRGYGNLVIINHNNEYLSAYAHNDVLLVKEGQKVQKGQVIARMGKTDADRVKLHFEIRYKGNSVNPRNYLP